MSVPLHTHARPARPFEHSILGRITTAPIESLTLREDYVLTGEAVRSYDCRGYAGLLTSSVGEVSACDDAVPLLHSARNLDHLEDGDIVALHGNGYVRTLYREHSSHNTIFATDRCNSLCLMCSQPPREGDDHGRMSEHFRLIDLIPPDSCANLGVTGGEPTLLGEGFLQLLARCRDRLPATSLHVLTNGRLFASPRFAEAVAEIGHPDLVLGIPLYSAVHTEHDYVVQAEGAFLQTMTGLQNLGAAGVRVEIRVVLHKLTVPGLLRLAEYLYRNVTFASHVAFMGLEMMGFAVPNVDMLWIDPWDYRHALEAAVLHLAARRMAVSVYNVPLCLVPRTLWPYCRQSISDWKNDYLPECEGCAVRGHCAGFFSSSLWRRRSTRVRPIPSPGPPGGPFPGHCADEICSER